MRSIRFALAFALVTILAACGHKPPASVSQGVDRIFPEPPHEIRGATPVDQRWIDETVAAGQTCCMWAVRPRPNDIDRTHTVAGKTVPVPAPPKKKKLRERVRALIPT
jgi:hypothetical protein